VTLRALVVDDEPVARRRLVRMLGRIDGVTVTGEAADGIEALERIRETRPDVVLLDIRMPGLDGLTLAKTEDLPPVVFVTAFDEFAVQAFEASAVDYLMKPVSQERLEQALAKVRSRGAAPPDLASLLRRFLDRGTPGSPVRITARAGDTIRVFDPAVIRRFRASDKYTVFEHEGQEFLLDDSLTALERRLEAHEFIRIHRSELVNLAKIRALHTEDGGVEVELEGGDRVPVSRRMTADLKRRLGIA